MAQPVMWRSGTYRGCILAHRRLPVNPLREKSCESGGLAATRGRDTPQVRLDAGPESRVGPWPPSRIGCSSLESCHARTFRTGCKAGVYTVDDPETGKTTAGRDKSRPYEGQGNGHKANVAGL